VQYNDQEPEPLDRSKKVKFWAFIGLAHIAGSAFAEPPAKQNRRRFGFCSRRPAATNSLNDSTWSQGEEIDKRYYVKQPLETGANQWINLRQHDSSTRRRPSSDRRQGTVGILRVN
jgi:hypothetical protein